MLERDGYRCKKCGWGSSTDTNLEPHHVRSFFDGGPTVIDNLDTLCSTCHAELSWLWANEPPVPYAEWLTVAPAAGVIRMLLVISGGLHADGIEALRDRTIAITGITPEVAKALLYPKRPP